MQCILSMNADRYAYTCAVSVCVIFERLVEVVPIRMVCLMVSKQNTVEYSSSMLSRPIQTNFGTFHEKCRRDVFVFSGSVVLVKAHLTISLKSVSCHSIPVDLIQALFLV